MAILIKEAIEYTSRGPLLVCYHLSKVDNLDKLIKKHGAVNLGFKLRGGNSYGNGLYCFFENFFTKQSKALDDFIDVYGSYIYAVSIKDFSRVYVEYDALKDFLNQKKY